jgi:hypothetical protein
MAVMTAEQAAEAGKSLSFEKVWAALMETGAKMDRFSEAADKRHAETEKLFKEIGEKQRETEKQIDKVTKNVGGLNNSMGELVETLIAARLWEKFKDYDLRRAYQRVPIYDETGRIRTDIDILLSDTDCAMAVEVKLRLNNKDDVDDHLKRMELIRRYSPAEVKINNKRLMGAIAGGFVDPDIAVYAYECGFFVLELSGEAVELMPPPAGFRPREWL